MPYYTAEQLKKAKEWYAKPQPPKEPPKPKRKAPKRGGIPPTPPIITQPPTPEISDSFLHEERRLQELQPGYSPHEAWRLSQYRTYRDWPRYGTATATGQPTSLELHLLSAPYITDLRTRFEHRGGGAGYHPGNVSSRIQKEMQFGVAPWPETPPVPDLPPDIGDSDGIRYRARGRRAPARGTQRAYSLGLINWRIGL